MSDTYVFTLKMEILLEPTSNKLMVGDSTSRSTQVRNQGLVSEAYKWDKEEVSSDDNEMVEVKVLIALADDESRAVGKESAKNGEWVKISTIKCISEQIPNQKRKILGADHVNKDTFSCGQKDLVFIKYSSDDSNVFKLNVERPWFSDAEGLILPNHDTGRILPPESQVNVTDFSVTDYDSTNGCSRHMTGVKSYLHKYVEQLGPTVVFGDDSTCITEGYGSIKSNGIVFTKVAFVNHLKYNLDSWKGGIEH
nr:retrovirus-related Pol polyprotein from transposon TNT 1-94 [Tanacetum cinerariifolium]